MFGVKISRYFVKRVCFFGTNDFGLAILKRIHARTDVDIIKVCTTGED